MGSRRPPGILSRLSLLGREPTFRRLFLATIGSGAGTWLALVALEVDVYERTGSSAWIAALLIADLLPMFVIGLLVGPLLDRLSRRSLMIGADLVRVGAFAVLPFTTNATQIVALAAVVGIATGFFRPAVYAGLPNLVEDAELPIANSLLQAADNLTWALGSIAGGALTAAAGVNAAYWFNAVTFLLSAALLVGIPQRLLQAAAVASQGHWQDVKAGFSHALRSPVIRTVLVAWNVAVVSNAAVNVSEPSLALRTFSAGRFGLGLMMGCAGLGLTVGALVATGWIEQRGLPNVYGVSLALMGLGVGGAAASPNVWVAALCVVVAGGGNGAAIVCNALLVQRGAPDELRGRIFAMFMSTNVVVVTAGMVLGGWLTDVVGARWVWAGAGAFAGAAAIVGFGFARRAFAARAGLEQEALVVSAHAARPAARS
jgi:MFS family permease